MPLESASFINDLVSTNPAATDTVGQGYQHLNLIKAVLKAQFPNWTSAALTSTNAAVDAVAGALILNEFNVPAGSTAHDGGHMVLLGQGSDAKVRIVNDTGIFKFQIWNGSSWVQKATVDGNGTFYSAGTPISFVGEVRLWSGSTGSIPTGWHLCDGTTGTPDLRDRFIVGAGGSYSVGLTGGINLVTLTTSNMPSHTHTVVDSGHLHGVVDPGHSHGVVDPGHVHGITGIATTGNFAGTGGGAAYPSGSTNTNTGFTSISVSSAGAGVSVAGAFTGISIAANGSGTAFENRPPYFALCYIMRVT